MALHADVGVNGRSIGDVYIQRTAPLHPRPETVCTYRWEVRHGNHVRRGFGIQHRYGDGPFALIARVLIAAGKPSTGPEERVPPQPEMHTQHDTRGETETDVP